MTVSHVLPSTELQTAGQSSYVRHLLRELILRQSTTVVLQALLLFVFAFALRAPGALHAPLQSDEAHWLSRSSRILGRLETDPWDATTHLGHPGVTPALVMVVGQVAAKQWNHFMVVDHTSPYFLDEQSGSRLATLLFSALAIPLLFIGLRGTLGTKAAFFGAVLFAFDPLHISLSRIAHLDGSLTTVVLATALLFFYGVERGSSTLKLLGGCCWGLAIATKPTALVLIPIFVFYKLIRLLFCRIPALKEGLFTWSDVGAVFLGHVVFAAIHTRLWYHNSELRIRLRIVTPAARVLFRTGNFFITYPISTIAVCCALAAGGLFARRRLTPGVSHHLCCTILAVLISVATLAAFPQIYENFARFWAWTFGLSNVGHDSFGSLAPPMPGGYPRLFVTMLPIAALIGLCCGGFALLHQRPPIVLFLLLIVLLWSVPLGLSSKQSWRYALPLVPPLYGIIGWGVVTMSNRVRFAVLLVPALFLLQAFEYFHIAPWFENYVNPISITQARALEYGVVRPRGGQPEAAALIDSLQKERRNTLFVSVLGDGEILADERARLFPAHEGAVRFGYFPPMSADLLVHMPFIRPHDGYWTEAFTRATKIFSAEFGGLPYLIVYDLGFPPHGTAYDIPLDEFRGSTGNYEKLDTSERVLVAITGTDAVGYLGWNAAGYRFPKGQITSRFSLSQIPAPAASENARAVRFEFTSRCMKTILASELPIDGSTKEFELACDIPEPGRFAPRVYWPGDTSVRLHRIVLSF